MKVWLARNPEGTRFRIEIEGHPGIMGFYGWQLRTGDMAEADWQALYEATDDVEIERLHQELWARLTPAT